MATCSEREKAYKAQTNIQFCFISRFHTSCAPSYIIIWYGNGCVATDDPFVCLGSYEKKSLEQDRDYQKEESFQQGNI